MLDENLRMMQNAIKNKQMYSQSQKVESDPEELEDDFDKDDDLSESNTYEEQNEQQTRQNQPQMQILHNLQNA